MEVHLSSASILRLHGSEREVQGVDADIRAHTRESLTTHPLAGLISTIEGISISAVLGPCRGRLLPRRDGHGYG